MLKSKDKWPISVCTWSLHAETDELPNLLKELGSPMAHLAISDLISTPEIARKLSDQIDISATMIGFPQEDYTTLETIKATGGILPDNCWQVNLNHIKAGIELTARLNVPYMTFHAGFIDESNPEVFEKMTKRIITIADIAESNGVTVLMETGQETAADLSAFMQQLDQKALGINFDPANMILYNKGNPIDALQTLAPWIRHIHIKDALKSDTLGEWGTEVTWGSGEVNAGLFLDTLASINYEGVLAIEREAGASRMDDIKRAISILTK